MTTTVNIVSDDYTAVLTSADGSGLISVGTAGGLYFRIQAAKPAATDIGHYAEENDTIELTKALASGKSLWVRAAQGAGFVVITADSEV